MNALPFLAGNYNLFVNRDMFEEAGINLPGDVKPITYADFLEISKKLTKEPDQYGWAWPGVPEPATANWVFPIFWSTGARLVNEEDNTFGFSGPEARKALQFLVDYETKYKLSPAGTVGMKHDQVQNLFLSQKTAIWEGGSMMYFRDLPEMNWWSALMPVWDDETTGATYGTADALLMFSNTKYPADAWRWLEFVMRDKYARRLSVVVGAPSARIDIGNVSETINEAEEHYQEVIKRQWEWSIPMSLHPATSELYEIFLSEVQAARLGTKTVEEALADAEKRGNEAIARY